MSRPVMHLCARIAHVALCGLAGMGASGAVDAAPGTVHACRQGAVEVFTGGTPPASCDARVAATRPVPSAGALAGVQAGMRVDPRVQAERDGGRHAILNHELAAEHARLAVLARTASADASELARTRANIDALQRELAR